MQSAKHCCLDKGRRLGIGYTGQLNPQTIKFLRQWALDYDTLCDRIVDVGQKRRCVDSEKIRASRRMLQHGEFGTRSGLAERQSNRESAEGGGAAAALCVTISIAGLKEKLPPWATASRSAACRLSASAAATILPRESTTMVVGRDVTPYRAKTLPEVSTPTQPAISFRARNACTTFGSSSSTEMN